MAGLFPGFVGIEIFMTRVRSRKKIKLLIADDHPIFREALRKLLESEDEIKIVGEVRSGTECIQKLGGLKPDILLLDLRMPDKNGLAVLEEVNFNTFPTRVIVLTAAEDTYVGIFERIPMILYLTLCFFFPSIETGHSSIALLPSNSASIVSQLADGSLHAHLCCSRPSN